MRSQNVVAFLLEKIMSSTEISAKEFGALQATVEHIKDSIDKHTIMLERMEEAMNKNVPRSEFEQYKRDHATEIKENYLRREEAEALLKFWRLITSNLAKLFAVALVSFAVYATGVIVKQSQEVTTLKEDIQHLETKR